MSLRHAILVTLDERPGTGYEISQRFDAGLGHFWQASHQQVYLELKRLSAAGHIHGRTVAQDNRPDKRVYRISAEGRRELRAWLAQPARRQPTRNGLLVKLFAAHLLDVDELIDECREHEAHHTRLLAHYRDIEHSVFAYPETLNFRDRCRYLTLRRGIGNEESTLAWYKEVLATLLAAQTEPA